MRMMTTHVPDIAVGDFDTPVLLVLGKPMLDELKRQAAVVGMHAAEMARTACKVADSELDGLNVWAHSRYHGRRKTFLIRMHRDDAERLRRQAARLGRTRAALIRACIAAHLRSQPNLPIE